MSNLYQHVRCFTFVLAFIPLFYSASSAHAESAGKPFVIAATNVKSWEEFQNLPVPLIDWVKKTFAVSSASDFERWLRLESRADGYKFLTVVPVNYGAVAYVASATHLEKNDAPKLVEGVLLSRDKENRVFSLNEILGADCVITKVEDKNKDGHIEITVLYWYEGEHSQTFEWTGSMLKGPHYSYKAEPL